MPPSRAVIGLISDTHGRLGPQLADVFSGVDRIVHAGDVGDGAVLGALAPIAPAEAIAATSTTVTTRRCRLPGR